MKKTRLIPYLAAMLALAASASASHPSDAWITMKTKMALLSSPDVAGLRVEVDTRDGEVTLHGNVESRAQEQQATVLARGIEGVHSVRNLIQIVPGSRRAIVKGIDADIRKSTQAALEADSSIRDSAIHVDSVNKGVVLLTGTATSTSDSRRALVVAGNVPGVVAVETKVLSPNQMLDDELWQSRKPAESAEAWQASDAWLTTATKLRLLASTDTPGLAINVDTNDGVVTLFGMVPTEAARMAAEAEARKVDDVVGVVNALQVVPESRQDAVEAKDDQLQVKVEAALAGVPELKDSDIDVEVKNGVVRLTGTTAQRGDRLDAVLAARRVPGVRAVRDDLQLQVPVPKGG